jgi:hypothetical protein
MTRPEGSLCTLRRVGCPSPRNTRYRLLASFTGRVGYPLRTVRGFKLSYVIYPPRPGFPGARATA